MFLTLDEEVLFTFVISWVSLQVETVCRAVFLRDDDIVILSFYSCHSDHCPADDRHDLDELDSDLSCNQQYKFYQLWLELFFMIPTTEICFTECHQFLALIWVCQSF